MSAGPALKMPSWLGLKLPKVCPKPIPRSRLMFEGGCWPSHICLTVVSHFAPLCVSRQARPPKTIFANFHFPSLILFPLHQSHLPNVYNARNSPNGSKLTSDDFAVFSLCTAPIVRFCKFPVFFQLPMGNTQRTRFSAILGFSRHVTHF